MRRGYIIYNSRTCVTGKALFDELVSRGLSEFRFKRCNIRPPATTPDFIIRWGNSLHPVPESTIELNSRESVANTTDKKSMLRILQNTDGVCIPDVLFVDNGILPTSLSTGALADEDGNMYIRDHNDHVRYSPTINSTDKYALRPINKLKEYRVHVFNNKVLGIYEKIPQNSSVKIYKNDTCEFKRIDQGSTEAMRGLSGLRPMAKAAVTGLGLLFGGVDVLKDAQGNFFVTEVNTAPALNEPNVVRWVDAFLDYLTADSSVETDQSTQRVTERSVPTIDQRAALAVEQAAALAAETEERRVALSNRVRQLVESEGFAIANLSII